MRRAAIRLALLGVSALLVVAGPQPASAVDADAELLTTGLRIESADTSDHPEVEVTLVAPGELVDHTLRPSDVTVSEGGRVRPVEIERLPAEEQEVVLVLDVSGSMGADGMAAVRSATRTFLARVPAGTRVAVVAFATTGQLVIPFADDPQQVQAAVDALRSDGTTALYDAVVFAAGLFKDPEASARTVVLLADGEDNASTASLQAATEALARAEASAYAVELQTGATNRTTLQQLVAPVGGRVASTSDPARLDAVYDAAAVEVASRYRLRYRSVAHGVTDLEIAVDAEGVHQRVGGFPLHLPEQPGWKAALTSPAALLVGLLGCYAAAGIALFYVLLPRPPRLDLAGRISGSYVAGATGGSALAGHATGFADRLLRSGNLGSALASALELAGLSIRPAEFLVLVLMGVFAGAAAGLLLGGPVLGLLLAVLVPVIARALLRYLAQRKRNAFDDQLDDTLQLLASSMRAGLSLMQSVQAVSRDGQSPTADEFRRVVNETRLGRDLGETLEELGVRMGSKDFQWVSQAIGIHRDVGGDLAELLDTVGETIRDRGQMRRQVKALSAEGRLSAIILMGLPVAILVFLSLTNPGYLAGFTASAAGWALVMTAVVLMVVGALWLRKMVKIDD